MRSSWPALLVFATCAHFRVCVCTDTTDGDLEEYKFVYVRKREDCQPPLGPSRPRPSRLGGRLSVSVGLGRDSTPRDGDCEWLSHVCLASVWPSARLPYPTRHCCSARRPHRQTTCLPPMWLSYKLFRLELSSGQWRWPMRT